MPLCWRPSSSMQGSQTVRLHFKGGPQCARLTAGSPLPGKRAIACFGLIAKHLTIKGKKLLIVHAKWIGRCRRRSVKLQHG
jgi:hypothetical protein